MGILNKKIISFDPEIFGIDISDLSIKIMQLEKEGKIDKIRNWGNIDVPSGIIEDGIIVDREKAVTLIKSVLRRAKPYPVKTKKVICSLPESKGFLRIISIPKMEKEEAQEAIKWEMEANIPMPMDQVYFDWQFMPTEAKNRQDVLTVAVSKDVVDNYIDVLSLAGLEVYGLEIESVASVRSLVREDDANEACLIVDLGAQRTSFIIILNGAPYFTSSIPFSSESINDALVKDLRITLPEAEKIKLQSGIESSGTENPIFNSIKSLLENLVGEIGKTLDFYGEFSKESVEIKRIILCGGGANLKGLIPYLAKRLKKEVELGDPWVNVKFGKNTPQINKEDSVRYSTVIGLALRGKEYED